MSYLAAPQRPGRIDVSRGSPRRRDAVRPLRHIRGVVRAQPRGGARRAHRTRRSAVSARTARSAVSRRRRQRPCSVAGRSERALPRGGRAGGVPGAGGGVRADRRGAGTAAPPMGLLPLPARHATRHRRSRRRAVRDPHDRRSPRRHQPCGTRSARSPRSTMRPSRERRPIRTRRTPNGRTATSRFVSRGRRPDAPGLSLQAELSRVCSGSGSQAHTYLSATSGR